MSDSDQSPVNPLALSLSDAAKLLTRIGGRLVTLEMLQAEMERGAPTNPDGTLNLMNYTAWQIREMVSGD